MKHPWVVLCTLSLLVPARRSAALGLHPTPSSPYDLAVSGNVAGVPAGGIGYLRWSDLRALPTSQIKLDGEFVKGTQTVTIVFLSDLWKALPVAPGSDTLLATCASDGYAAIYTLDFMARYRPFVVLEINGQGPDKWPPPGLAYNPGPYVISVSADLAPAAAGFRDMPHKKPWGVTQVEVARSADRLSALYSGKWASLSPDAEKGREIWINSCASCHKDPEGKFGGTKSGKPFQVLAAYAAYDRAYFERYVHNPQAVVPTAKMEPHPWYTDAELRQLEAFVTAGGP